MMKNNSVRKTDEKEMSPREKEIAAIFKKVEKKYWGQKSSQLKIYLVDDLIIIRSCGNLSPAEEEFAKTEEGRLLLKQLKVKELDGIKNVLKFMLENKLNTQVLSITIDTNPELNETIIIARLKEQLK
jgi:uncharacterized protein YbcI